MHQYLNNAVKHHDSSEAREETLGIYIRVMHIQTGTLLHFLGGGACNGKLLPSRKEK